MRNLQLFNGEDLHKQIQLQKKMAWCLESDIPWQQGVDLSKGLVPLDARNLEFPGASVEQKVVLSQLMGLVINETISEMESSLPRLKYLAWEKSLRRFPVNPEMFELGELFFAEEEKHAASFQRYLEVFCAQAGVEVSDMKRLLPKALNSNFQRAMIWNAERGGASFWWLVAAVEEVSVQIFRAMLKNRSKVDPLFFELHRKHTEEEARHENYAYLMLKLAHHQENTLKQQVFRKTDLWLAEVMPGPWVITELTKIFRARELRHKSPFFEVLSSCIPLFEKTSKAELIRRLYTSTPYMSWLVNPRFRAKHRATAENLKVPSFGNKENEIDFKVFA